MTDKKRILLFRCIAAIFIIIQVVLALTYMQRDTYASESIKYATAVFDGSAFNIEAPFMSAMGALCRILGIHPLVFAHNHLAVAVIILACLSYLFLLGRVFKDEPELKYISFYFVCLLNIFGYWSGPLEKVSLLTGYMTGWGIIAHVVFPALAGVLVEKIPLWNEKTSVSGDVNSSGGTAGADQEPVNETDDDYLEEWDMKKHPIVNARNLAIALAVLAVILLASVFVLNNKINTLYDATVNLQNQLNEYADESEK